LIHRQGSYNFSTLPQRLSLFDSAVFNELYYLADGGSVWLDVDPGESIPPTDLRYLSGTVLVYPGEYHIGI
jgi:hypothetical protein